jgi:hypothetical protein
VLEKRNYRRYDVWFPVTLDVAGLEVWAICRDASSAGVLISSVSAIAVGTVVSARFKVSREVERERTILASVVRSEVNADALVLAFPHRVALAFECPVPELVDELAAIADGAERSEPSIPAPAPVVSPEGR